MIPGITACITSATFVIVHKPAAAGYAVIIIEKPPGVGRKDQPPA